MHQKELDRCVHIPYDRIDKAWERRGTQQRHSYPENPKCHDADYLFCEDLGIVDNGEGGWRMK